MEAGIKTDVGENLAEAPTVYFAHQALMRSAIHRENILDPTWDRVGLGFSLDEDGYIIIAEEFSYDPWTATDLEQFEYEIIDKINNNRADDLLMNPVLRSLSRSWSTDMISQNFFSFTSPSGINLIDTIQSRGITQEGRSYILKEGKLENLYSKLMEESDVLADEWQQIGIGIEQDEFSTLYVTVVYTQ
jgi:uncharacterized protein YkwD